MNRCMTWVNIIMWEGTESAVIISTTDVGPCPRASACPAEWLEAWWSLPPPQPSHLYWECYLKMLFHTLDAETRVWWLVITKLIHVLSFYNYILKRNYV